MKECLTCIYCDETLFNRIFCDSCKDGSNYKLNDEIKLCSKCDSRNKIDSKFCTNCGKELN